MPAIKIPKLPRNKYNYIKGADGNMYVTQTQLMMSSGNGGGGGGGGGNNPNVVVVNTVNQQLADRGVLTYDNVKTINGYSLYGDGDIEITAEGSVDLSAYMTKQEMSAYVSKTELDNASYLNQTYLNSELSKYPTFDNIEAMSYATTAYVLEQCKAVEENCYAYTDSKTKNELSYAYITQMFNDMVARMIADGDLVNAAYVVNKVNEGRV